ncbi:hypothetical protein Tco_1240793 [Tanacetum coccineum]
MVDSEIVEEHVFFNWHVQKDAPTSATTIVPNTPDDITNDVPEETQAKIPSLVPPKPFVSIRKSSMSIDQPSWLKDFVTAKYKALMAPYVPTIAKQHVYPLFHDKDFKNTPYCLKERIRCLDCRDEYDVLSGKVDTSYPTGGYDVSVDLSEQDT